ncbi:hypothetical protein Ancab_024681 [Ancistrocladus abbreviatus]
MSRRRGDLVRKSREGRVELGPAPYLYPRGDAEDEQRMHPGQSLSPHTNIDGTRSMVRHPNRNSPGRMEYHWHMGHGRGDLVQSMSPPTKRVQKRHHAMERVLVSSPPPMELHRKYERQEYPYYNDYETNTRLKHGHNYGQHIQSSKEDYMERKLMTSSDRGKLVKDSMAVEDGAVRKMVKLHPDSKYVSGYKETSKGYSTLDARRSGGATYRYQDAGPSENLLLDGYHKYGEKYAYPSRDVGHPPSPTYQFNDSGYIEGNPTTSSGVIMRDEFSGSLQDASDPPNDGHQNRGKLTEIFGANVYSQKPLLDDRRDYEGGHMDIKCQQCDVRSNSSAEDEDYLYSNLKFGGHSNHGYIPHDALYEKRPSYAREDHDHRALTKSAVMDPRVERITEAEGSHRILRHSGAGEFHIIAKESALDYQEMRGTLDISEQDGDYMDSCYAHAEFSRIGELQEHKRPDSRLAYGYGRYAMAGSEVERVKSSPEFMDDEEMQRLGGRPESMVVDKHVAYNKALKRKSSMEERIDTRVNARSLVSNKRDKQSGTRDVDDSGRGRIDKIASVLHSKEPSGCQSNHYYLEAEEMFDEIYHHEDPKKDSWCSYQGKVEYSPRHCKSSYKSGGAYMKGSMKAESSKSYSQSDHVNQRSDSYKQHRVWKRIGSGNHMEVVKRDAKLSEDLEGPLGHKPAEESEGFKQMVHMAFLSFSKKLNENPVARKLYKEQGEAGSLFCIVCGRKSSKEFQDTQRLVTHTYMSLKVGLRAEHLGLHKAICVLMGWNSVAAPDIVTWTPQPLPQAEAMAQKEDLILWPPVVIVHNISLSNHNHKEWKVISVEALGDFLRSKGFNRGKMRLCLGNPGDQSVLVVKFLGTFSGLQEAERLHKFFSEKQHGRRDFEQVISNTDKSSNPVQGATLSAEGAESLLCGYMGISEDLDRVDFDTKKRCFVKSRKEIQDLADAPVKPD